MIEHLRKYTGLIIVLFVLVIIGFFFMDTSSMRASGSGQPYIKIAGRKYSDQEFRKLGPATFELTQSLAQAGDYNLMLFAFSLSGDPRASNADEQFFINRMILRSAKEEFGIYPGDEEIDTFIRKLPAFSGPDGAFSSEAYRNFIEKGIGRLGLTEGDLRSLASDVIAQGKVAKIIGAGLTTPADVIAAQTALDNQRIRTNVARIDAAPIEKTIEVTEEEIKSYWETIQDAFRTPEKRKFSYIIATPETPEAPAELPAPAADATDEQKAEYETKQAEREGAIAEANRMAQLASDEKVDEFLFQLEEDPSLTFEKLAEKDNWDLKTTELFSYEDAPAEINAPLRASSSQGTAANVLFTMIETSDPFSKISPAIAIGENQWLIARLDGTEESRVQTFEEARDEARARLIADKTTAALRAAAEESAEKIKAALAEGKTFQEAAEAAGIENDTLNLPEVTRASQQDTTKAPANLFEAARYTDPGELADPVIEDDRAFIIHVETREIVKSEEQAANVAEEVSRATEGNQINVFSTWLRTRADDANVEKLYAQ
ncbi:SurA N-terminal domain-containing protein [Luteolibacter sp. AS25]|uniref:SurA N-terminal domain-containing protein n=1 Tax=Luteolibacter sp. AS25 TaxID=3135776 RepID=UPI00398B250C